MGSNSIAGNRQSLILHAQLPNSGRGLLQTNYIIEQLLGTLPKPLKKKPGTSDCGYLILTLGRKWGRVFFSHSRNKKIGSLTSQVHSSESTAPNNPTHRSII